ncbi:MAG: hypothetical protein LIP77_01730 [Planctomycetes bacterium]|nr:hypothetical protein [Planctomycetota bacterium]
MTGDGAALRLAQYRADLAELADTDAGQRFFAQLFAESGCLASVHRQSAEVYRLSGVQAFGLAIWRDLHAANPEASAEIFDALMSPIMEP